MSKESSQFPPPGKVKRFLKEYIWPIETYELKKFIPMFCMFFCISFSYTILRDMKDTLVVNAPGSGAEAIPFLKLFCVTPAAFIFMAIYIKLSGILDRKQLFLATLMPFLIFFALFGFVLYPLVDKIHPYELVASLRAVLPEGAKGPLAVFQNWSYSLFYIAAELWGSVVLSVLFWGFANQITKINESKRFYALFQIGANLALMVSGPFIIYITNLREKIAAYGDPWGLTVKIMMGSLLLSGVGIVTLYLWMQKNVLTDPRLYDEGQVKKSKKKVKMGLMDSIKYLASSKYVGLIALLVLGYGVSINLVEVTWKNYLKEMYPNSNDYLNFMGKLSFCIGLSTVLMALFASSNIIRRFGWGKAALVTPTVLTITGILFFLGVLNRESMGQMGMFALTNPLFLIVVIGAIQNILSKSCKYSLFDPTKEMAYIPLNDELKVKGKAAVDGVGGRLGKSGGAAINAGLIFLLGNIVSIAPYVFAILLVIVAAWYYAIGNLNREFVRLSAQQDDETSNENNNARAMDAQGNVISLKR